MSTWEERMAQRAASRAAERARAEHEAWLRQERLDEVSARQSPEYLAGPPDGCAECYLWVPDKLSYDWHWVHRTVELPGHPEFCGCETHLCEHACHPANDRPWAGFFALA